MFSNLFNNEIVKFYNGTNHDVSIYKIDNENFKSNRNYSSFRLINAEVQPKVKLEQRNVLDVKRIVPNSFDYNGVPFSLPDSIYPVEQFTGAENFDVIIVSRFYAENALKFNLSPDYIDRLYIVGSRVIDESGSLIGNSGLQKAVCPLDIVYYINAFENNRIPSLVSAKLCLQQYKNMNTNMDLNTHNAITKLERYIATEESKRKNSCASNSFFSKVFNV